MSVVAHHPVIIHFKGIPVGFNSIDVESVCFLLQLVAFISYNASFVNRQILFGQCNACSFCRYPYWSVIVSVPLGVHVQWVQLSGIIL